MTEDPKMPKTLDSMTLARNIDAMKFTKKDVRLVLKALKKRWSKNYRANLKLIAVVTAMQGGMLGVSDEDFSEVWDAFLLAMNKLIILNGTVGASEPNLIKMRDDLIHDIEHGEGL